MTESLYSMASLDQLGQGTTYTQRPMGKFKKVNRLENAISEFHQVFLWFLPLKVPNQIRRPYMKSLDASCRKTVSVSYLTAKDHFLFSKNVNLKDVEEFSRDNLFRVIGNSYRSEIPSLMSMQKLDHDLKVIAAQLLLAKKNPFELKTVKPLLHFDEPSFLETVSNVLNLSDGLYLSSPTDWARLLECEVDVHRQRLFREGLSEVAVTALPPKASSLQYFLKNVCQQDEIVQKDLLRQKEEQSVFAKNIGLLLSDSYFYVDVRPVEINGEMSQKVLIYADPDEILSDISSESD